MSWGWSHTGEAYDNARQNLFDLDKSTLRVIYAEWRARHKDRGDGRGDFSPNTYAVALAVSASLEHDVLVDSIWENMSEQATCDNGGFTAWACPYGCGGHMVSFGREEEEEEIKV